MYDVELPQSLVVNRTVEPLSLAVSLSEAKSHLLVTGTDDDTLITSILNAAIREAEKITGRQLFTATYVTKISNFPASDSIVLFWPPLQAVTSITYVDSAGTTQTLSTNVYSVDTASDPGRVTLKYNQYWPDCRGYHNDVVITYTAGWSSVGTIPEIIKSGIKLLIQAEYDPARSGDSEQYDAIRKAAVNLLLMERCQGL